MLKANRILKITIFGSCFAITAGFVGKAIAGPVTGVSLIWPVPTGYTSKPGQDYAQFNDGSPNRHHAGIDIPAPLGTPVGTPVVAAYGGTVRVFRLADFNQKTHCFGNVVIINHNGLAATLYAHLNDITVSGDTVTQGQQIGTVGNTLGLMQDGTSCGSTGYHLHFELKNNAVLGTISDDGTTWGYTPEPGVTGYPVPADHPDSWGFHDPILNLHAGITTPTPATVVVTSQGTGVSMRTGPDADYRTVGLSLVSGQQFNRIREFNTATANCSAGWYQITNLNGQYFTDSISGGSLPDVWVCRGNGTENWVTLSGETLSVTLTANPPSGTAPLTPNLAADVSGTSTGTINYSFWWDCNDQGTDVSTVSAICGSPWNSAYGAKYDGVLDDPKTVNHTYSSVGTYTAKVIAERGTAPPAESRATITVNSSSALPTVVIAATTSTADEETGSAGIFTVTRSGGSTAASLTVYYTVGGTATAGSDYNALPGYVVIPAGQTSATINVAPLNDTVPDNGETVVVTFSANAAYTVGTPSGATVTIQDSDSSLPTVTVSATTPTADEETGSVGVFTVTRSGGSTAASLTVYYSASGTATAGMDYQLSPSNSVTIPAGQNSATVYVFPLNDAVADNGESVIVTLSTNSAYQVGTPSSATVTIQDSDSSLPTVTVSVATPTADEETGSVGVFTVTRSGGSTAASLTVYYSASGTATAGMDYQLSPSNSVTIPAGQNSATVYVFPLNDAVADNGESVIVTLSTNSAYQVGTPSSATVTIQDSDSSLPTVTVSVATPTADEETGSVGVFTVTRSGGSTATPLTVYYTASGTATAGSDYNALSGSVVIPAGQTSATINVAPLNDTVPDNGETVVVTFSANAAYTVGTPSGATVTIQDGDAALTLQTSGGGGGGCNVALSAEDKKFSIKSIIEPFGLLIIIVMIMKLSTVWRQK